MIRDDLLNQVYDELRSMADALMRKEPSGHTLQPTALVHEAYLRLHGQDRVAWADETHFRAIAAIMMQRVLRDHVRRRMADKRGGNLTRVSFEPGLFGPDSDYGVLEITDAIERLSTLDERQAKVVSLRLLGGLSVWGAAEYQTLKATFLKICDLEPREQKAALLEYCEEHHVDPQEVESLLQIDRIFSLADTQPGHSTTPEHGEVSLPPKIDDYTITGYLGQGGMGTVFKGLQHNPERPVAIKVMNSGSMVEERLRRFRLESEALGRLQHAAIAQIHSSGIHHDRAGDQPYIAMEYIDGQTVTDWVRQRDRSREDVLVFFREIVDAVHYAHQRGIIHRDLKPANILVTESGQPKVLDFSVARFVTDQPPTNANTTFGQVIGTVEYMSPEQISGDPELVDIRCDTASEQLTHLEKIPWDFPDTSVHYFRSLQKFVELWPMKDFTDSAWEQTELGFLKGTSPHSLAEITNHSMFGAITIEAILFRWGPEKSREANRLRAVENTRALLLRGKLTHEMYSLLSTYSINAGEYELARVLVADWRNAEPESIKPIERGVKIALQSECFDEALKLCDQYLERSPEAKEMAETRAQCLKALEAATK